MAGVSKQRRLTDEEREKADGCVRLAMGLARYAVRSRRLYGDVAEGVHDKAVDGLLKAATAHDPHRGQMTTCAGAWVRGYIGHALRPRPDEPGREPYHVDSHADPRDPFGDIERAEWVAAAMAPVREVVARLPARQRLVIERLYGLDGQPPAEGPTALAAELGINMHRVKEMRDNAIMKIQYALKVGPGFRRAAADAAKESA